jgi:hypothetical protein
MELQSGVCHVETHYSLFGRSVSVGAKLVHGFRQTYYCLINFFGRTRWYSWVRRLKWKLISIHLEIVLILTHESCMVCAYRTVGTEIVLDAPDGTPR